MPPTTIFVTYNLDSEWEQTLAVRLQTAGSLHGYTMLLPDRCGEAPLLNPETRRRINSADYFVLFSISQWSPPVQAEIQVAYQHFQDKSRIVIVYDRVKNWLHAFNCTKVVIDTTKHTVPDILQITLQVVQAIQGNAAKKKSQQHTTKIIGALLLIGLALLVILLALRTANWTTLQ